MPMTANQAAKLGTNPFPTSVLRQLMASGGDVSVLRVYRQDKNGKFDEDGASLMPCINEDGSAGAMTVNAPSTLGFQEWLSIEKNVTEAARLRSNFVNALIAAGCVYEVGTGMASSVLLSQKVGLLGPANIGMSGLEKDHDEAILRDTDTLPLPFIHKGISITLRDLLASRQGMYPIDMGGARQAGMSVGETIEQLSLGTGANFTFGGTPIYGIANHPGSLKVHLAKDWADTGTEGNDVLNDVIAFFTRLNENRRFGPFIMVVGTTYWQALARRFSTYDARAIRTVLLENPDLKDIVVSDFVTAGYVGVVQATPDSIRIVSALAPQVLQWEENGGLEICLKAMAIQVPQIRADYYGRVGVLLASTAISSN